MSILVDLMSNAVDEAYAQAAARRGAQAVPPAVRPTMATGTPRLGWHRGRVAIAAAVALALAGALFATSAVATHRGNAAATRDRKQLVAQVTLQTAATDELERQVSTLGTQVSAARTSALSLTDRGASLLSQIKELEPIDGAVAVEGSGVRVILDDAPASHAAGSDGSGVIIDSDLRAVVNGLFIAGAQAISINGQRLTAQTAIREAGGAILVDFRPLSPPYTIDAIGPSSLGSTFATGPTGQLFVTDHQLYGLGFTIDDHQRLTLPSAANVVVHYAKPLESP
jgi:uncharacterized protein YlxW (UPF0749 family)